MIKYNKDSISNLKKYAATTNKVLNLQRAKYLELRLNTNSSILKKHLNEYVTMFAIPANEYEPKPHTLNPTQKEEKAATQLKLLTYTSSPSTPLISYKGINLGSAINMKLAVKLGSLLGKQQG